MSEDRFLISIICRNTITWPTLQFLTGIPVIKDVLKKRNLRKKYNYVIRFSNICSRKYRKMFGTILFFLNTYMHFYHMLNECNAWICNHSLEITPEKRLLRISCSFFGEK